MLAIIALLSLTVVYPVVHEGGHYLMGRMLGVEVRGVTWTVWGGRPHVLFGFTPAHAVPWIAAGGLFLPTVLGVLFITAWLAVSGRIGYVGGAMLWIPALVLLAGNLGAIGETMSSRHSHLRPLALHFGLSGTAAFIFQALPALISLLLFVFCVRRVRGMSHNKNAQQTGCTERRDRVSVDNRTRLARRR